MSNLNISNSVGAKKTAIDKMREYFLSIKSFLIYDDDIKRFAQFLNLDHNILLKEYRNKQTKEVKEKEKTEIKVLNDEEKNI